MGDLLRKHLPLVFGMLMYCADPEVIRGMLSHAPLLPRLSCRPWPPAPTRYARRLHGTTTP